MHVHAVPEGSDETDSGVTGPGGDGGKETEAAAGKLQPALRCTCNLSPETQDLLKEVFKDIVSVAMLQYSLMGLQPLLRKERGWLVRLAAVC